MANMFPSPLEVNRFISKRDFARKLDNNNVSVPSRGG